MNKADSEVMAGVLAKDGFNIVDYDSAELVVINSCTVKGPTVKNFWKYLEQCKQDGKKIVIAGCITQADNVPGLEEFSVIGTDQLENITAVVEETMNGNVVKCLVRQKEDSRYKLPVLRSNKFVQIVPICKGCLGNCAYCKTKLARGGLVSYAEDDIIALIKDVVKEGVKEVWLTAQDTGTYGKDIGTNLVSLLDRVLHIPGRFKVRLGMINPNFALEFLDDLIRIFKNERMFKFLHVPLQSGNDDILSLMNRKYTNEDVLKIVSTFRDEFPFITIATDIICGFPTETEEQFEDTVKMIKECKFEVVNISKYWPMEGTSAYHMEQISNDVKSSRCKKVKSLFENISLMNNEKWLNWEGYVIIDEKNKYGFVGHNFAYKPVSLKNGRIGDEVFVKVTGATTYCLKGKVE